MRKKATLKSESGLFLTLRVLLLVWRDFGFTMWRVCWDLWWFVRHICLYKSDRFLARTCGWTGHGVINEVLVDQKVINWIDLGNPARNGKKWGYLRNTWSGSSLPGLAPLFMYTGSPATQLENLHSTVCSCKVTNWQLETLLDSCKWNWSYSDFEISPE